MDTERVPSELRQLGAEKNALVRSFIAANSSRLAETCLFYEDCPAIRTDHSLFPLVVDRFDPDMKLECRGLWKKYDLNCVEGLSSMPELYGGLMVFEASKGSSGYPKELIEQHEACHYYFDLKKDLLGQCAPGENGFDHTILTEIYAYFSTDATARISPIIKYYLQPYDSKTYEAAYFSSNSNEIVLGSEQIAQAVELILTDRIIKERNIPNSEIAAIAFEHGKVSEFQTELEQYLGISKQDLVPVPAQLLSTLNYTDFESGSEFPLDLLLRFAEVVVERCMDKQEVTKNFTALEDSLKELLYTNTFRNTEEGRAVISKAERYIKSFRQQKEAAGLALGETKLDQVLEKFYRDFRSREESEWFLSMVDNQAWREQVADPFVREQLQSLALNRKKISALEYLKRKRALLPEYSRYLEAMGLTATAFATIE